MISGRCQTQRPILFLENDMLKRESGVDLFRCLGLLFVTGLHAFLYNGFYSEAQGLGLWPANTMRWLFSGCNGMFMLMTGYLKGTKPVDRRFYRGLLTVLTSYALVFTVSLPVRYLLLNEKDGWTVWLQRFFTFEGYAWYVEMYIGLMLLALFVNPALAQMQSRRGILLLAGSMVLLTALPSLTPAHILPDYWSSLYPLTYYVLGASIRRLDLNIPPIACLLGAALTACLMGLLSSLTAPPGTFTNGFAQGGFGGCLTTLMVTLLFLGVYRLSIPERAAKGLAWLSGGVFEGYLISRLFDVWVYDLVPFWHKPECYPLIFLCITIPVFLCSACIGKAVHKLAVTITKHIPLA